MARQRHLDRAPIREAIIDIQFAPAADMKFIAELGNSIGDGYRKPSDIWQASIGVNFEQVGAGGTTARRALVGKRFDGFDGKHVLQCRVNGFTFSRLPPYEDWTQIRTRAKACWDCLSQGLGASAISRLAVRYINALPLPLPIGDFRDYLEAPPQIPARLPQEISGFVHQVLMADREAKASAIVTQALENPSSGGSGPNAVTILFDIDTFRGVDIPAADGAAVWQILDDLRNLKNRIFFEHLTERTVELFE